MPKTHKTSTRKSVRRASPTVRGRNGGLAISQNRAHMAAIGRRGAVRTNEIRAEQRARQRDAERRAAEIHERNRQFEFLSTDVSID